MGSVTLGGVGLVPGFARRGRPPSPPCTLIPQAAQEQLSWEDGSGQGGERTTSLPQIHHGRDQDFKGNLLFLKGLRGTLQESEASNYKG